MSKLYSISGHGLGLEEKNQEGGWGNVRVGRWW